MRKEKQNWETACKSEIYYPGLFWLSECNNGPGKVLQASDLSEQLNGYKWTDAIMERWCLPIAVVIQQNKYSLSTNIIISVHPV